MRVCLVTPIAESKKNIGKYEIVTFEEKQSGSIPIVLHGSYSRVGDHIQPLGNWQLLLEHLQSNHACPPNIAMEANSVVLKFFVIEKFSETTAITKNNNHKN